MIGQCLRFHPAYALLKEYVDNGTYGKAYRVEFIRYSQTPTWTWNNWILDPEKSGGCVLDMHVHDVDLINWIFGIPGSLRSVITNHKSSMEAIFTQYFYSDLFVTASADWSLPQKFPFAAKCLVNFDDATVVIEGDVFTIYKDSEVIVPELHGETYFEDEIRSFVELVIDGCEMTRTSAQSVSDSVMMVMKEIESAHQNKEVIIQFS